MIAIVASVFVMSGSPVRQAMHREHCECDDSDLYFHTTNYHIETTSRTEWWFVVDHVRGLKVRAHPLARRGARTALGGRRLVHLHMGQGFGTRTLHPRLGK